MRWDYDGVEWARDRYNVVGPSHGFAIEILTLVRPGKRGWRLIVTKEHWWAGARTEAIKNTHWARPLYGQRKDIIEWFRKHEAALDRRTQQQKSANAS